MSTTNANNKDVSAYDGMQQITEDGTELLVDFADELSLFIKRDGDEVVVDLCDGDGMGETLDKSVLSTMDVASAVDIEIAD
jgi:hypothetical protein